jgi:hypothetical protein
MAKFDFEKWWMENVGEEKNVIDIVYKKIARDLLKDILSFYCIDESDEDIVNIDLSNFL